ncbi:adhesion G protein-coupled receptor E3-like isoform X3 [Carassius carassius]|uniref:adhesion G protein-coupled receptor E3-like isoform X3 n=2 Tax=Carassius carassius TaxID=217509 RepID=UPI0028695445|nr:adhesion G protein-coupled receptor E3-like isoform X3 [Carassius carassius]
MSMLTLVFNTSEKILESSSSENSTELALIGNIVLKTSEKLISTLVKPTDTNASVSFTLAAVEGQVFMVGPQVTLHKMPRLDTTNSSVDIDLIGMSKNNNERSAAVAFMSYVTMENLLKPDFFNTSNDKIKSMMSTVISATLPKTTNTKLTKPVNFTFRHIREFDPNGSLSCVYWNISEWIGDGCSVLESNNSYTVCSCDHLSTFALIMQTSRPPESQTPGDCFQNIFEQIENITDQELPLNTVTNILTVAFNASEKIVESSSSASRAELASYGNRVLKISEKLISTLVKSTETSASVNFTLPAVEGQVFMVGPQVTLNKIPRLAMTNSSVDIDLIGISKNNNGRTAAVAFMSYVTMENLLKPDFFNTSNDTIKTMMSTVISVTLPKTTNTKLTKPVNFTFRNIREFDPNGSLSCVYWNISEWIGDGCSVLKTNNSYTVCSCDHLSTFALIMQTSRPPESDSLLDLLNLVCVIVGLVFFSLALLTFAFCQWSPLVNNVARINICISLLLAHLLFLLTQPFLSLIRPQQVLCAVISGLLHFLFLSGFVWMFIEAVLLFICVKNLSKISSKKRMVLSTGFLCVIGYVVALVVVCVSVGLVPEGYGSKDCWIKIDKGFIWSFLGPVCVILASNTILFINIVISLNSALKSLNAEVSQIKQTKIMVFKTLAQFVVLGCPWIMGFFSNNSKVLEILFLILNSQQGTFIFLIYCVLNNKVREQYRKFFRCLCSNNTEDHSVTFRVITTE